MKHDETKGEKLLANCGFLLTHVFFSNGIYHRYMYEHGDDCITCSKYDDNHEATASVYYHDDLEWSPSPGDMTADLAYAIAVRLSEMNGRELNHPVMGFCRNCRNLKTLHSDDIHMCLLTQIIVNPSDYCSQWERTCDD